MSLPATKKNMTVLRVGQGNLQVMSPQNDLYEKTKRHSSNTRFYLFFFNATDTLK